MNVTTGERHLATGATRTCPKCQGRRLTVQFETVYNRDSRTSVTARLSRENRDRFQCLDCWHIWYEEVK